MVKFTDEDETTSFMPKVNLLQFFVHKLSLQYIKHIFHSNCHAHFNPILFPLGEIEIKSLKKNNHII